MGQQHPKLSIWVEKVQNIEEQLDLLSYKIDEDRVHLFDLVEIPHLRELGEPNLSSDIFLIENAFSYMKDNISSQIFLKDIELQVSNISKIIKDKQFAAIELKKKYENLNKKFKNTHSSGVVMQSYISQLEWKLRVILQYFSVDQKSFNSDHQNSLNEILSEPINEEEEEIQLSRTNSVIQRSISIEG